ncbi:MAG TPA: TonB-dependent receptor [Hyphomonadaceae bacterium]|nr:TonB-dependent receptor [Hyphomonadaceae bacterium]
MKNFSSRTARTSWIALVAGASLAAPAFAQSAVPPATAEDAEAIIVTGSALPVEQDKVGYSLTVVSSELIEDQGYSYVPDVLRQVPGLAVNQAGSPGSLTQVRIRGAEGNHTLVLLDGVDVSSADQGETDLSTLLSGDIDRIEVLRGPQSGLYGSNALAGVINLITRRKIDGDYVNFDVEGGEQNTFGLLASAGFGNGEDYASTGFQVRTSDGYDVSASTTAQGVPTVGLGGVSGDKEGNEIATLYLRGGKAFGDTFRIDGFARYLDKHTEMDGQAFNDPIPGRTYDDATTLDLKSYLLAGSGTLSLMDGRWETIASASLTRDERRGDLTSFPFFLPGVTPTPADLAVPLDPNGADATRAKIALQSTYEFGADGFVSYVTGFAENKQETFKNACPGFCSPEQRPKQTRELTGVGVQYRAEILSQFYLFATARHDANDSFDDADTYSVAASWVVPNTGTRPHASIGTGVTNPTFTEQFGFDPGSFVGNPNLVPEEATGWDAGIEQTLFDNRLIADLTYFQSTLEHEIFTAFGPPPNFLSTSQNRAADSDRSGLELSVRYNPTDDIGFIGSWTNLDATEPAGIETRRPENQGSLDATWRVNGGPMQLNLGVTYNGEQVDTDFGTFLRTAQDPYTLVRLGLSYQLTDGVEIYGRVENLTDERYEEVIGFLGSPRAAYIGLRFKGGTAR